MGCFQSKAATRVLALIVPVLFAGCGGRECYVGVRGTEASLTVKAMFPGGTCAALVENPATYLGDLGDGARREFYEMSERPPQPVICEYTVDGKHFIVRDDGLLKVVGNILCSSLARRAD